MVPQRARAQLGSAQPAVGAVDGADGGRRLRSRPRRSVRLGRQWVDLAHRSSRRGGCGSRGGGRRSRCSVPISCPKTGPRVTRPHAAWRRLARAATPSRRTRQWRSRACAGRMTAGHAGLPARWRREICNETSVRRGRSAPPFLLLAGVAAAAPPSTMHGDGQHRAPRRGTAGPARDVTARQGALRAAGRPAAPRPRPYGTLRDSYGAIVARADMEWDTGSVTESTWYSGDGAAGAGGAYSMDSPAATTQRRGLGVSRATRSRLRTWRNITWAAAGPTTSTLLPGPRLSVYGTRGGPWSQDVGQPQRPTSRRRPVHEGRVDAIGTSAGPSTAPRRPRTAPTTEGSVNFYNDEGVEFDRLHRPYHRGRAGHRDERVTTRPTPSASGCQRQYWGSGKPGVDAQGVAPVTSRPAGSTTSPATPRTRPAPPSRPSGTRPRRARSHRVR